MGPFNQIKKMFHKTRIIATLLVLVSFIILFSFTKINSLANGQNFVGCHKQSCVKSLDLIREKSQQSVGHLQLLTKVTHVFIITLQSVNSNLRCA